MEILLILGFFALIYFVAFNGLKADKEIKSKLQGTTSGKPFSGDILQNHDGSWVAFDSERNLLELNRIEYTEEIPLPPPKNGNYLQPSVAFVAIPYSDIEKIQINKFRSRKQNLRLTNIWVITNKPYPDRNISNHLILKNFFEEPSINLFRKNLPNIIISENDC